MNNSRSIVSGLSVLAIILFYSMNTLPDWLALSFMHLYAATINDCHCVDHENPIDVAAELSSNTNNLDPG